MARTKGGTADLLHSGMDNLSLNMPHVVRHQAFKVSNGSCHFVNVIPPWDLMIYNGFFIYESLHMESVYSFPNSPPFYMLISLSLVSSLSSLRLVLKPFFTITMPPPRYQAHSERCSSSYSNLRTHAATTF